MKHPTDEQIRMAAEWLRINEGEEGEAQACHAVADWIEHEADERVLRSEARKAGVTVARLRRMLADKCAPRQTTDRAVPRDQ